MSLVDKKQRNNILSYALFVSRFSDNKSAEFQQALTKYLSVNAQAAYNPRNINDMAVINSRFAAEIKSARYDDLFDDFIKSGYINLEDLENEGDLREQLTDAMDNNPFLSQFRNNTPRRYTVMVNRFIEGLRKTSRFDEIKGISKRVIKVTDERIDKFEELVNEKQRDKFRRFSREERVFIVTDETTKAKKVIYQDRNRFRNLNTGRFASKPKVQL